MFFYKETVWDIDSLCGNIDLYRIRRVEVLWEIKKLPKSLIQEASSYIRDELSFFFCDPLGVRTQDPNIKSVVLYQLS